MSLESAVVSRRQRHDTSNAYACYEKSLRIFFTKNKRPFSKLQLKGKGLFAKIETTVRRTFQVLILGLIFHRPFW